MMITKKQPVVVGLIIQIDMRAAFLFWKKDKHAVIGKGAVDGQRSNAES